MWVDKSPKILSLIDVGKIIKKFDGDKKIK